MSAERLAILLLVLTCTTAQYVVPPKNRAGAGPVRTTNTHLSLIEEREVALKPANPAPKELPALDLQMRLKDVEITATPAGEIVTVETDEGLVTLTAEQYVRALANTKAAVEHGGFVYKLFNISKPWGVLWISIGFLGQALFTFRMILQWWASEKHKRSVVPIGFWWGSLLGGMMLFVYFIWRKDIVGIVGQSTGVFVYARNLILIYRGRRVESENTRTMERHEPGPVVS